MTAISRDFICKAVLLLPFWTPVSKTFEKLHFTILDACAPNQISQSYLRWSLL